MAISSVSRTSRTIRIGTRGSPLALAQTRLVRAGLETAHDGLALEEVVINTTGDQVRDRPLSEIGGKGLFTKEIDEALLDGRIDCAVHSLKDVPTWLPDGLILPCFLPREDPRDVLICHQAKSLSGIPSGAAVGTVSLRRQAQILALRPDLKIVPFRGNIGTRLQKLDDGEVDATLLAVAGLSRLNIANEAFHIIEPDELLSAVGQGAIGIMCRKDDQGTQEFLAPLNDSNTASCVRAERAMLDVLDGTCHTPIGGLATIEREMISLRGLIAKPDGSAVIADQRSGNMNDPERVGRELGQTLLAQAGPDFMNEVR